MMVSVGRSLETIFYTHIHLGDLCLELILQFLDDTGKALSGLVNVVDHSLADERGRGLLDDGEYIDTPVEVLLSRDTGHFG
jgi:hypothetical protein